MESSTLTEYKYTKEGNITKIAKKGTANNLPRDISAMDSCSQEDERKTLGVNKPMEVKICIFNMIDIVVVL